MQFWIDRITIGPVHQVGGGIAFEVILQPGGHILGGVVRGEQVGCSIENADRRIGIAVPPDEGISGEEGSRRQGHCQENQQRGQGSFHRPPDVVQARK